MRRLTPKQQRFVKYYLQTDNATKAVKLAGYDLGGLHGTEDPNNVANAIGAENLAKPSIRQAIDKALVRQKITPEYVLQGLSNLAEQSDRDGDRIRSYELLGKYLKIFSDSTDTDRPTQIILRLGMDQGKPVLDQIDTPVTPVQQIENR